MKTRILLVFLLCMLGIHSQELKRQMLASAGSGLRVELATGNYFIHQSIAQHSVIGTYGAENYTLRQGYIQPLPTIVLGGDPNNLEVVVYPNPFTNGVVVNLEQGLEGTIGLELFDISGRLVKTEEYDANSQLTIPLPGLSQGAYFMKLSSGQQQTVKQLLKR